jgi:hypothetical protein
VHNDHEHDNHDNSTSDNITNLGDPMSVRFTIGMAHFEDYHGAVFTIQSILGSPDASLVGEVIVIDSSPGSSHSAHLKTFCDNVSKPDCRVRFIEYTGPNSTTQPRQAIFDHAAFPYVLVMDCHVLLSPGFLRRLEDAYQTDARDALITGPRGPTQTVQSDRSIGTNRPAIVRSMRLDIRRI